MRIKVFVKSSRKPLILEVDNIDIANKFFAKFENENRYVKFGNFIIDKSEFRYAICE